ncbi:hypothetical protein Ciccas_011966 [Cichlidogyrus casuarinus]|uniref:MIT domain-containing protein n=1 Tax=Cichlidogyrus casuarinus TaxID=1844966 RepID=A0ABD2PPQ7_9PLAT
MSKTKTVSYKLLINKALLIEESNGDLHKAYDAYNDAIRLIDIELTKSSKIAQG